MHKQAAFVANSATIRSNLCCAHVFIMTRATMHGWRETCLHMLTIFGTLIAGTHPWLTVST